MMNKIFKDISEKLKIYIDDIIVKSIKEGLYDEHLVGMFQYVGQFNMRPSLEKRTLKVRDENSWASI